MTASGMAIPASLKLNQSATRATMCGFQAEGGAGEAAVSSGKTLTADSGKLFNSTA